MFIIQLRSSSQLYRACRTYWFDFTAQTLTATLINNVSSSRQLLSVKKKKITLPAQHWREDRQS